MQDAALWTIDELTEFVASALAAIAQEADYAGRPNGRVREVPDRRTIRWYTTIGLLERPAAMRGRTALYGRRHLLQLVAAKRLQAQGLALVEVQERLMGTDDAALEDIARLPAEVAEPVPQPADAPADDRRARRFWAATPAEPAKSAVAVSAAAETLAAVLDTTAPDANASGATAPRPKTAPPRLSVVPVVHLGSGVSLLLNNAGRMPDADDLYTLEQAAAPLLELLRQRGLDEPHLGRDDR